MKTLKLKSILFGLIAVFAIAVVMTSCEQEAANLDEFNEIDPVVERIIGLGHQEKDIVELDDFYLVEGCIMYPKNLEFYIQKELEARQASTHNLVSQTNVTSMTVFVDASIPTSGVDTWRPAINAAIADMSGINNSSVNFSLVNSISNADIVIESDGGSLPNNVIASAGFPSGGQPYNSVIVNLDFFSNMTVSEAGKRYNMVHELGHCIGLRHTNWVSRGEPADPWGANQIPGTPTSDPNSVMNGGTALSTWAGFSSNDIVAIETLYPTTTGSCSTPSTSEITFTEQSTRIYLYANPYYGVTHQFRYRLNGGSWQNFTATTSHYNTITPKQCGTYEVQLRQKCGSTWSSWSGVKTINTTNCCDAPASSEITFTEQSTRIYLYAHPYYGDTHQFRYRFNNGSWKYFSATTSHYNTITPKQCGTYKVQLRQKCGSTWSGWSSVKTITSCQ